MLLLFGQLGIKQNVLCPCVKMFSGANMPEDLKPERILLSSNLLVKILLLEMILAETFRCLYIYKGNVLL